MCARCYAWSVAHHKRGEMCGRWQIMAADDFQAFNKMMVQRQRQLSYESLKQIQRMQLAAGAQELRGGEAEGGRREGAALLIE